MTHANHPGYPHFDPSRPILIIGAGVMGTRVAWACADAGIPTRLFDALPGRAEAACAEAACWSAGAARNLTAFATLADAAEDVQLAFENVPEQLPLKQRVLAELGQLLPTDAYMGSNTSSLLCTPLAEASGRAPQFFNMNFSDPLRSRLVELMGCAATVPATIRFAQAWAAAMKLVLLHVRAEQHGYSHNRMWRVIKKEALRQIDRGIATPEDIDLGWMVSFGGGIGPCGIMDAIGLGTVLAVEEIYHAASGDEADRPPEFLRDMVAQNRVGVQAGQGFYRYPDPVFRDPHFLTGSIEDA